MFTDTAIVNHTVGAPMGHPFITANCVVSLNKPDGVAQTMFSSLTVALNAWHVMNSRSQYYMVAGDDTTFAHLQKGE